MDNYVLKVSQVQPDSSSLNFLGGKLVVNSSGTPITGCKVKGCVTVSCTSNFDFTWHPLFVLSYFANDNMYHADSSEYAYGFSEITTGFDGTYSDSMVNTGYAQVYTDNNEIMVQNRKANSLALNAVGRSQPISETPDTAKYITGASSLYNAGNIIAEDSLWGRNATKWSQTISARLPECFTAAINTLFYGGDGHHSDNNPGYVIHKYNESLADEFSLGSASILMVRPLSSQSTSRRFGLSTTYRISSDIKYLPLTASATHTLIQTVTHTYPHSTSAIDAYNYMVTGTTSVASPAPSGNTLSVSDAEALIANNLTDSRQATLSLNASDYKGSHSSNVSGPVYVGNGGTVHAQTKDNLGQPLYVEQNLEITPQNPGSATFNLTNFKDTTYGCAFINSDVNSQAFTVKLDNNSSSTIAAQVTITVHVESSSSSDITQVQSITVGPFGTESVVFNQYSTNSAVIALFTGNQASQNFFGQPYGITASVSNIHIV